MRISRHLMFLLTCLAASVAQGGTTPRSVEIVRDRFGVPHIFVQAKGDLEALVSIGYALGYAQAQDRLFEMEIFRRAARGRLAELAVVGASFLPMDIEARRDNATEDQLQRDYRRLSGGDRQVVRAHSAGINRFLAEVTATPALLPLEFLGQVPSPWMPTDTLALGELQFRRFGVGGGQELDNARVLLELRQRFSEAEARGIFNDQYWIEDPSSPVTIDPTDQVFSPVDQVLLFAPAQMALLDRFAPALMRASSRLAAEQQVYRQLARRLPVAPGGHASNAIVLAGHLSASGYPILLGGPQTGLNLPNFFWEAGIHFGDQYAHGVGLPGTPGIVIGRTDRFAFTITSSADDDSDIFAEILDPQRPDHYLYGRRSRPFERRTETFLVAGQPTPPQEFLYTVHGPVIFIDQAAGIAFSRARALDGRLARTGSHTLKLALSRSLRQFLKHAKRIDAGFNLHYADVDGNIAYFHAGRRPRRPANTDPRLPLLGTGEHEWRGGVILPRPQVINPARGIILNWNNKPAVGWPHGDQREFWGPLHRVQGLSDWLASEMGSGGLMTPERVNQVMRRAAMGDVFALRIVPFLSAAVATVPMADSDRAALLDATQLIEQWVADGAPLEAVGPTLPHPGATLYRAFRTQAQRLVFADELRGHLREMFYPLLNEFYQEDDHGSFDTPDALFYRALQGPAAARPLSRDYFHNVDTGAASTRDQVLVAALRAARATLASRFGTDDMSAWLEPKLLTSYMNISAANLLYGETITERQNRGSFNLLVDLAPAGESLIITPPGQNATITPADTSSEPPHLRDQLPLYEAFLYRTIAKRRQDIEGPLSTTVIDVPADL